MASGKKDYSMPELIEKLQTVIDAVKTGNYQNTVFGAPQDAASYDVASANANSMVSYFVNKFSNQMLEMQRMKRMGAVSASFGTGHAGTQMLNTLYGFSPDIANNLLGHHGAGQAVQSMMMNANAMANATGRGLGGIMNFGQMGQNFRWAATQGALALNNNFNAKGGTINTDFTHGLSLNQAAIVGNHILANTSQYDDWAKRQLERTAAWRAENGDLQQGTKEFTKKRKEDGILMENEIQAFRHGTSMSHEAVRSFNDHIKNFQKEMNGFVASVSKITGSFDTAIDFIQDLTNGQAFNAGEKASKTREKAAQTAANLRVMSADAGMAPGMMYNIIKGIGASVDNARGRSYDEQIVGDRSVTSNISTVAAGAFAQWAKANPNATEEERQRMLYRINSRAEGFAGGDAIKNNVLLAELVKRGKMTMKEAMNMAANSDESTNYKKIREMFGSDIDMIRDSSEMMDWMTRNNSDVVNQLNSVSLTAGISNEAVRYNQRNALDKGKAVANSTISKALGRSVTNDIETLHKNALMNEDTLREAGLSEDQIRDVMSKTNLTSSGLHDYIIGLGGVDEVSLNKNVSKNLVSAVKEQFGDNENASLGIDMMEEMVNAANPEATDTDIKKMVLAKKVKQKRKDIAAKKIDVLKGAKSSLDIVSAIGSAAAGENGTTLNDDAYVRFSVEKALGSGVDSQESTRLQNLALGAYNKAYHDDGLTSEEAFKAAQKAIEEDATFKESGRTFKGFGDKEDRRKTAEEYAKRSVAAKLFERVLPMADLDEEQQKTARDKFLENIRGAKFNIPKRGAKDTDKDYEGKVMAALSNTVIEAISGNGEKGSAAIDPEKISRDTLRSAFSTDVAYDMINKTFMAIYDKMDAETGSMMSEVDLSKLSPEELAEYRRKFMEGGGMDFNSAASRVDASGAVNAAWSEGLENLRDRNSPYFVGRGDARDAKNRGKVLGELSKFDKKILAGKFDMGAKKNLLTGLFGEGERKPGEKYMSLLDHVKSKIDKSTLKQTFGLEDASKLTNEHLMTYLNKILSDPENAKLTDEELEERLKSGKDVNFAEMFLSTGLSDRLLDQKDEKGNKMSIRSIVNAFNSGIKAKSGKERAEALEEGYMKNEIGKSTIESVITERDYMKEMVDLLTQIKDNTK